MSDFLSRLAGRALGVEPVVQPVIPAMAAPGTFTESEGFQEAPQDSPVTERTATRRAIDINRSETKQRHTEASLPQKREQNVTVPPTDSPQTRRPAEPQSEPRSERKIADPFADATTSPDPTLPTANNSLFVPTMTKAPNASSQDRRATASSAPPIVRVTIGRIEVRAELPGTKDRTPSTQRSKNSAISLDDYLKQRTEGRR